MSMRRSSASASLLASSSASRARILWSCWCRPATRKATFSHWSLDVQNACVRSCAQWVCVQDKCKCKLAAAVDHQQWMPMRPHCRFLEAAPPCRGARQPATS